MEEEQDSLELRRYLEILTRWWWLILAAMLLVGGGAYAYTKAAEHTVYSAEAIILVQEARGAAAPTFGDVGLSLQLAGTYEELITTRPLLENVALEIGQGVTPGQLGRMVSVSTVRDTPLLKVKAEGDDPDLSVTVVNTVSEVFIQDLQTRRLTEIARLQVLAEVQGVAGGEQLLEAQFSSLSSLTIVEPAVFADVSVEPPKLRTTTLGAVLGLVLGVLAVFLLEYLNRSIRSTEQIEKLFGAPDQKFSIIGVIHKWRSKDVSPGTVVMQSDPSSVYSEMFRQVRTSFQFAASNGAGKVFLITSATPLEGKSTITANLGVALAQGGSRVILMEADMRRPSFGHMFIRNVDEPANERLGLSDLLVDPTIPVELGLGDVGVPRLKVLMAGAIPPNPADLLDTERTPQIINALKEQCDYLLVDSPPVLAAADPMILASKVDGVILVATLGESKSDDFKNAVQQIQRTPTPLLGYVLNKMGHRSFGGYHGYRYRYYNYYLVDGERSSTADGKAKVPSGRGSSSWRRLRRKLSRTPKR